MKNFPKATYNNFKKNQLRNLIRKYLLQLTSSAGYKFFGEKGIRTCSLSQQYDSFVLHGLGISPGVIGSLNITICSEDGFIGGGSQWNAQFC